MPWLRHKTYVDLIAKREEASDKRESAIDRKALKDLTDTVDDLSKQIRSLRGYLYKVNAPDEEDPTDPQPLPASKNGIVWGAK